MKVAIDLSHLEHGSFGVEQLILQRFKDLREAYPDITPKYLANIAFESVAVQLDVNVTKNIQTLIDHAEAQED